jgi:uncharacterized protein
MFHLGEMAERGLGVTKDLVEARNWYTKASERGMPEALWRLALFADRGVGSARDPAGAANRAMIALKRGSSEARRSLFGEPEKVLSAEAVVAIQRALGREGLYLGPPHAKLPSAARDGLQKWASAR